MINLIPEAQPHEQGYLVNIWNLDHGVGTPVKVLMDDGTELETRTRSTVCLLGGHTAVIWLKGIKGCYALERVTAC